MNRIFWAGDSTVQYNDITTYPQTGIGQVFGLYCENGITIVNCAKNGRSTKSFIDEGRLHEIEQNITEGDFLFIQFGHNDEKKDKPERYAAPYGEYTENLKKFASAAYSHGAYPVLITPLARRNFGDDEHLLPSAHAEHAQAMRELAQQNGIPIVDLLSASRELLERVGKEESYHWYMHIPAGRYTSKPEGLDTDNTHLQYEGAVIYAGLIASGLEQIGGRYGEILLKDWKKISPLMF